MYDFHHRFISFNKEDEIFLKLHHEYALFKISNLKFVNQRADPFKILKKIDNLTYKIDVFAYWRIYLVISITQFESAFKNENFYRRTVRFNYSSTIIEFNEKWHEHIMKKLINKRQRYYEKGKSIIEYLIRWFEWRLEFD